MVEGTLLLEGVCLVSGVEVVEGGSLLGGVCEVELVVCCSQSVVHGLVHVVPVLLKVLSIEIHIVYTQLYRLK